MFTRCLKTMCIAMLSIFLLLEVINSVMADRDIKTLKPGNISAKTQFHELTLEVPEGTTDQELSVEYSDDNLAGITLPFGFKAVSKPFRFGPHGLQFTYGKEPQIKLKLDQTKITQGYNRASVKLYFINRETKLLEPVDEQQIDSNGYLLARLKHFSDYVAGVTPGWEGSDINPYIDYVHNGEESVAINQLQLNVLSKVIFLPGRGGLDLKLNRAYYPTCSTTNPFLINSHWYWATTYYDFVNKRLFLPDGSSYNDPGPPSPANGPPPVPYTKSWDFGNIVVTFNYLSSSSCSIKLSNGILIKASWGTQWGWISSGTETITDSNNNQITYNFSTFTYTQAPNGPPPSVPRISSIVDSAGRTFRFNYNNVGSYSKPDASDLQLVNIEEVTSGNLIQWMSHTWNGNTEDDFTDANNRTTRYNYINVNNYNSGGQSQLIQQITYPNTMYSQYSYNNIGSYYYITQQHFNNPTGTSRTVNYILPNIYDFKNVNVSDGNRVKVYHLTDQGFTTEEDTYLPAALNSTNPGQLVKQITTRYYGPFIVDYNGTLGGVRPKSIIVHLAKTDGTLDSQTAATTSYTYDEWANVIKETLPNGKITFMAYANTSSANIDLTQYDYRFINPTDKTAAGYDRMLTKATLVVNPLPNTVSQIKQTIYHYDANGNLIQEQEINHDTDINQLYLNTDYSYDSNGNMLSKTDANGNQLCFEYSSAYQSAYLTRVYNPQRGTIATYDYGNGGFYIGKPTTVTDPNNNTFTYQYDAIGRLIAETLVNIDPMVGVTRNLGYDDVNSIVTLRFGGDKSGWQYGRITYDPLFGKPSKIERELNDGDWVILKSFTFDSDGRTITEIDGMGHAISYTYDVLDRVFTTTLPDTTSTTTNTWDDHTLTTIDARGNIRVQKFDLMDHLIEVGEYPDLSNPSLKYSTSYAYDSESHLVQTTNPRNASTHYIYDNLGRLLEADFPQDGPNPLSAEKYTYDNVGNLKIKTGAKGTKTINYEFFAGYRQQQVTETDLQGNSRVRTYTYDNNDNILSVSWTGGSYDYHNPDGSSSYDARNRAHNLTATLDKTQFNFAYDYDVFGRQTSITYPNMAGPVTYNYDELDRLQNIPGFVNSCNYDLDNKLIAMLYANGIHNNYNYDVDDRPTQIAVTGNQGSLLKLDYSYDQVGNITQINNDCYDYDGLNRLTWEGNSTNATSAGATGTQWSFDSAGNFLCKNYYLNGQAQPGINYTTDLSNRLTAMGPITLIYDNSGACTSKVEGPNTWNYQYDSENRLITVLKNNATVETNAYDGNGMRVKKVNNGLTTYYLYNGANLLFKYAAGSGILTYYIYANNKEIAKEVSGVITFNHKDHLGSTRLETDIDGKVIHRMDCDAYGNLKPYFEDDFNNNSLSNWTSNISHNTQFNAQSGMIKIVHSTSVYGGDYLMRQFDSQQDVVYEFDAMIGSVNNDCCSLGIESNSFSMTFFANQLYYYNGSWKSVGTVAFDQWNHYRIELYHDHVAVYVNGNLMYNLNGSFGTKTYLAFRDYGLCSGIVTNYLDNVKISYISGNMGEYDYAGKKLDQDTGLVYFGARWYDPETGRFITPDSYTNLANDERILSDGFFGYGNSVLMNGLFNPQLQNRYSYCGNNPISKIDPDGNMATVAVAVFVAPVNAVPGAGQVVYVSAIVVGLVIDAVIVGVVTYAYMRQKSETGSYKAGDRTPGGRTLSGEAAYRANQRGFTLDRIDKIIDNNKANRTSRIDKDGKKTWDYTDSRGNTVVTNEKGDTIVTEYGPNNGGDYVSSNKEQNSNDSNNGEE